MKTKLLLCLIAAFIFLFILNSCAIPDKSQTASEEAYNDKPETDNPYEEENIETDDLSDQIIVAYPIQGQLITSPLLITGEARGTWFFEANFPISLLDSNDNVLVLHYAATEEEWMTEDFISFTASIEFEEPETAAGFLILDKNNPSDIREYDARLVIPVRFE
jgi:hypothetical protein